MQPANKRRSEIHGASLPTVQQPLHGSDEDIFDRRVYKGRAGFSFIPPFCVRSSGPDVTRAVIAVGRHDDAAVGTHGFGRQLVFNKKLSRQMNNTNRPHVQDREIDLMPRPASLQPGQLHGLAKHRVTCPGRFQRGLKGHLIKVGRRRQGDFFHIPADIGRDQR